MISEKELEISVRSDKINQNHFFQPLQKNTLSMIALQHVVNANYQKMEDIFQTNPFSMFVKAKVIIADVEIESSPLQYAIDNADSHAWKICQVICQKHPEYEMLFNKHQIQNPINLQPLYDAYDNYLKLFHAFKNQYKEDKYIDPGIQEAFLNVGKMQQACMPKHLLREMCQLPGRSEWYDLVLLSIEPDTALDLKQLKAISEQYQKCPVLVQQGHRMYIYGHSGDTWTWTITPVKSWPFRSIVFPFEYLKPQRFPAVSVTHEMWDAISDRALCCFSDAKGHCEPWRLKSSFAADNCPHSSNMVFVKTQSKSDDMQTFFFDEPGWGTEFVLARGAAVCCLAVYTPFGNNEFLGYRMEEDMKILKRIMEIRTAELKQQFSYAEPGIHENNSFSQG